jgi:hypothetical protein
MLLLAGLLVLAPPMTSARALAAAPAPTDAGLTFHQWRSRADFAAGTASGSLRANTRPGGGVTLASGQETGTWTSPVYYAPAPFQRLVPSWQADTPEDSWLEVKLSVLRSGRWSGWYRMGAWAFAESRIRRASIPGQADADGSVAVDTYQANAFAGAPTGYRVRAELHAGGGRAAPVLRAIAATTSGRRPTGPAAGGPSPTTIRRRVELTVPQLSQETHRGEYPGYDRGGEAWCSPTSVAMVLGYWHTGPTPGQLATLPPDPVFDGRHRADAMVDWAAMHTYDAAYRGAGNWSFNTAYAATYGLDASVRYLSSLRDAEAWVRRGVPVVVSIAWDNTDASTANDLTGAALGRSGGHLLVVRGFTGRGDVIVNDPAAPANRSVRRRYDRAQFERAWLTASHGLAYVIKRDPLTR